MHSPSTEVGDKHVPKQTRKKDNYSKASHEFYKINNVKKRKRYS